MGDTGNIHGLKSNLHATRPHMPTHFQQTMEQILVKLKYNPSSISMQDVRHLSENVEVGDERSANLVSAIEAFAIANKELNGPHTSPTQKSSVSLLTIVEDLHAAVDSNPGEVTSEVLSTAQSILCSKYKYSSLWHKALYDHRNFGPYSKPADYMICGCIYRVC